VLAVCAVLAGAQPRDFETRDREAAQLATASPIVSAGVARRTGIDAHVRPPLFVVPAWASDAAPPQLAIVAIADAPASAAGTIVPTRSSRGPPRS